MSKGQPIYNAKKIDAKKYPPGVKDEKPVILFIECEEGHFTFNLSEDEMNRFLASCMPWGQQGS